MALKVVVVDLKIGQHHNYTTLFVGVSPNIYETTFILALFRKMRYSYSTSDSN